MNRDIDRVWWPQTPHADESLLGFCVRTMDANLLPHLPAFLAQVGQKHRNRHVDIVRGDADPAVIAAVLGVAETEIAKRRGERSGEGIVHRGIGMDATDLCTRIRRFAPMSLRNDGIHRGEWCIRTLPFCPASLEILQSTCTCGQRQGWTTPLGPDRCQECGSALEHVPVIPSRSEDAAALRSYAGLFSLRGETNADAVKDLPDELRTLPRGELVELVLAFVPVVERGLRTVRRDDCWLHDGPSFTSAIARVWRLLEEWPRSLTDRAFDVEDVDLAVGRSSQFDRLSRLLSSRTPARTAIASDMIRKAATRMAVPGEGERHAIDFREAAELTSVSAGKLRRARRRGELETRHVLRRGEVVPVLSRTEIRELADMESIGASVLGVSTHMPRYAVAQLATGGIISAVRHPFVRERYGLRIEAGSVEDLIDRLERASVNVGSEALTLTLASAMSVVGGREKPYLEVFEALLEGRLPFTLTTGCGRLTRRLRIERTSLSAIRTMTCEQTEHYDHYVLDDARNVLNLHGRDAGALDPHRSGTKHSAAIFDRGLVRSLAERNIALGEAALRTGAHLRTVMGILNRAGVHSPALGWDRETAEAVLGIQPC